MGPRVRKTIMTVAALGAIAAGSAAIAGAASSGSSSSSTTSSTTTTAASGTTQAAANGYGAANGAPQHTPETALTGDTATKVKEAALADVSGGTIIRVETDSDHGSPYEAHVRKSDGTEVEVLVNESFEVTAVNTMGQR